MELHRIGRGDGAAGGDILDGHGVTRDRRSRGHRHRPAGAPAAGTSAAARADIDVLDGRLVSVAVRVRRADIVVHERVRDGRDLRVIVVRHVFRGVAAGVGGAAPGHAEGLPRARARAAGISFENIVGRRVRAVVADEQADIRDARNIVGVGPDPETGVRLDDRLVAVLHAEVRAAGIPRMPLRQEHRRRRGVPGSVRQNGIHVPAGVGLRDDGALAFVGGAAVIHEAAVEARQIIMPAEFHAVRRRGIAARIAHLVHARRDAGNLLRRLHPVFRRDDHAPVVALAGDAEAGVNHIRAVRRVARRPVPVDETRRTHVAVRKHPAAVLDMNHVVRGRRKIVDELLNGRRLVAVADGGAGHLADPLLVIARTAAPRIVAVVRAQHERRLGRIVDGGERRDQPQIPSAVTILPAEHLVARREDDGAGVAGIRVNVTGVMQLKTKRHHLRRRAAAVNGERAVAARALRRVDLVRRIRQIAHLAATAGDDGHVRAGARQMVVGDDRPRDAHLVQDRNHVFRETSFSGKITARERHARAPKNLHLPLLDCQFHLERLVADERRHRVMIGEVDNVHARLAAARRPGARGGVAAVPAAAVAELVLGG